MRGERAAYKKQRQVLSSNTGRPANLLRRAAYFGRRLGSPPGLPGGGITGVVPASGVGARISGSTPDGGHNTPSDRASLSPSCSLDWPTVEPSGAVVPFGGIGAQFADRAGAGGAVCCDGVARVGGCCAPAAPNHAVSAQVSNNAVLIAASFAGFSLMLTERTPRADVPRKNVRICGSGSAKNAPSGASRGVRQG